MACCLQIRMMETQKKSTNIKGILSRAESDGYKIAIATAGCSEDFVRDYLQNEVSGTVFTDDFLFSQAFQFCKWCAPLA